MIVVAVVVVVVVITHYYFVVAPAIATWGRAGTDDGDVTVMEGKAFVGLLHGMTNSGFKQT